MRSVARGLWFSLVLCTWAAFASAAQVQHEISEEVRSFAADVGPYPAEAEQFDESDLLTAVDIVSGERAAAMDRNRLPEDIQFAAWVFCWLLPWGPPKTESTISTVRDLLPDFIADAYDNEDRRQAIRSGLNLEVLRASPEELLERGLSPLDLLDFR